MSKPEPKSEETKPVEDTKPVTTKKSSDGKYDMTDADIENPDGTFKQVKSNEFEGPECIADRFDDGYLGYSKVNPSKIPYSQITVDNAAEAFPYLGWLGYYPDYVEILPGDSKQVIENKICANYLGSDPSTFYQGADQISQIEDPTHHYKSEAEYKQALADYKAEQQRQHEADKRADAYDPTKGDRIGDDLKNLSTEELNDLLWG